MTRPWFSQLVAVLVAAVFVFPTIVVIGSSFTSGSIVVFPPNGLSLRWYEELLSTPSWLRAAANSFQVGLLAAVIAMIVGVLLALAAVRSRMLPSGAITGLALVPLIVPSIVAGLGFYVFFIYIGLGGSMWGLALAHASIGIPYVFVNVVASLTGVERSVEEAARVCGANEFVTLTRVTLPMIAPAVVIGGVLAFISSWDEVIVAGFLTTPLFETLPTEMFAAVREGAEPSTSAVATIITLVSIVVMAVAFLMPLARPRRKSPARRARAGGAENSR